MPTYTTFNPSHVATGNTLSGGDLTTSVASGGGNTLGVFGKDFTYNTEKFHFEFDVDAHNGTGKVIGLGIAVHGRPVAGGISTSTGNFLYFSDGQKNIHGTSSAYGATYTTSDRITCEVDFVNETVEFFKNGTTQGVMGSADAEFARNLWAPFVYIDQDAGGANTVTANFGALAFSDTPTSGFTGWTDSVNDINATYAYFDTFEQVESDSTTLPIGAVPDSTRSIITYRSSFDTAQTNSPKSSGLYYFELADLGPTGGTERVEFGVANSSFDLTTTAPFSSANTWMVRNGSGVADGYDGSTYDSSIGTAQTQGTVFHCAVNFDTNKIWYGAANTWFDSGDPVAGTGEHGTLTGSGFTIIARPDGTQFYPIFKIYTDPADFTYTPPTGFSAWTAPVPTAGAVEITLAVDATASNDTEHGVGGAEMVLGVTSTATRSTQLFADGIVEITPVITGTGVSTWHVDGGVTLRLGSEGTGTLPTLLTGGVTATPSITATARTTIHAAGGAEIQALSASGTATVLDTFRGDATLPLLTSEGVIIPAPILLGVTEFPKLTGAAALAAGSLLSTNASIPALTIETRGGITASGSLPKLTVNAAMYGSATATVNRKLPSITINSAVSTLGVFTLARSIPKVRITAKAITGIDSTLEAEFRPLASTISVASGSVATASQILPALTAEIVGFSDVFSTVDVEIPALITVAFVVNAVDYVTTTYALNTENGAVTNYLNYDYLEIGEFDGKFYGVTTAGIFELTGCNDAGTNIAAEWLTGYDDLDDATIKRLDQVYVGYKSDGDMEMILNNDGEDSQREYAVKRIAHDSGSKPSRVTPARGIKSRYWQIGMKNVAGSDFLIEDVKTLYRSTERKT